VEAWESNPRNSRRLATPTRARTHAQPFEVENAEQTRRPANAATSAAGHAVPDNAVVEQVVRQIESGAYPYLLEHARQHDADHPQTSFEFGLI
jgi:hypothetical protein